MTHLWIQRAGDRFASLFLAMVLLVLLASAPAVERHSHDVQRCEAGHHEGACCATGVTAEADAAQSQAPQPVRACDETACAMMANCATSFAALALMRVENAPASRERHGSPIPAAEHASALLDGLKRPPRA